MKEYGKHGYGILGYEMVEVEIREPDGSIKTYTWKKPIKARSCDRQIKESYTYRGKKTPRLPRLPKASSIPKKGAGIKFDGDFENDPDLLKIESEWDDALLSLPSWDDALEALNRRPMKKATIPSLEIPPA
ncbi:hypothetical protein NG799_27770 [Laspinema sp. D1]|uniref:Transposase n=1 Tax=Laspinema palackyanum D2a TaxID=2953684 RepID=A0ABT2N3A7_9CYAN|nr:hypothetical protein [Laspinema sp. D2a]